MVPFLCVFVLFGQAVADTQDVNQFVDRTINHLNTGIHFFGYDSIDIPPLSTSFTRSLGLFGIHGELGCRKSSIKFSPIERQGDSLFEVYGDHLSFRLPLSVPTMEVRLGPCAVTLEYWFSTSVHFSVFVNSTEVTTDLLVSQKDQQCQAQVKSVVLNVGRAYIVSGHDLFHALEDWTLDAISNIVRERVIDYANEKIDSIRNIENIKIPFKCFKSFSSL